MATKLYVGGLAWATADAELNEAFSQAGTVVSARVMTDRETGRSRGFGFVEMASDEEAQAAISMWNGQQLGGRTITVNEARPMDPNRPRTNGGAGGNGGFRRGGGRGFGGGHGRDE